MTPISELTKNDIGKMAATKFAMPSYLIVAVNEEGVTFKNHIETYTDNSGYAKLENNAKTLTFVRNLESNIIHAVANNHNLCGVRHSQNSETTNTDYATCERCIELINK